MTELDRAMARPRWVLALLAVAFVLSAAPRAYRLDLEGLALDRDYNSAAIARHFHFERSDDVEPWRLEASRAVMNGMDTLEPPVTEFVTSILYSVFGVVDMRLGRLVTVMFWMVGGGVMFAVATRLTTSIGALVATAYYLFLPLGIGLSRSLQPEALMMLTYLVSLYLVLRYFDRPSPALLLVAGLASGLTILHRPLLLFTLPLAFLALAIEKQRSARAVMSPSVIGFGLLAAAPGLAYYLSHHLAAGTLAAESGARFVPEVALRPEFWIGWVDGATRGLGEVALVGALLGFAVLRAPVTRAATTGMMVGYLLFSVLFARHIFQNDYYHAQAIPLVAVLLGHLVSEFAGIVRRAQVPRWASVTGVFAALAVTSILELLALRAVLVPERKPTVPQAVADEVGALVGHSDRVVFVATYYGWPLVYKAELAGTYWPRSTAAPMFSRGDPAPLTVQERIAALPFEPEYFAVTDLEDYARNHADLADFLDTHCAERRERAAYRVYSSCEPGVP